MPSLLLLSKKMIHHFFMRVSRWTSNLMTDVEIISDCSHTKVIRFQLHLLCQQVFHVHENCHAHKDSLAQHIVEDIDNLKISFTVSVSDDVTLIKDDSMKLKILSELIEKDKERVCDHSLWSNKDKRSFTGVIRGENNTLQALSTHTGLQIQVNHYKQHHHNDYSVSNQKGRQKDNQALFRHSEQTDENISVSLQHSHNSTELLLTLEDSLFFKQDLEGQLSAGRMIKVSQRRRYQRCLRLQAEQMSSLSDRLWLQRRGQNDRLLKLSDYSHKHLHFSSKALNHDSETKQFLR